MEPHGTAAGQKCSKEPREKNSLQRKWVSEPCTGTKGNTYAESLQSGISGTVIAASGKLRLGAESQSSAESHFFPRSYSYQLQHSYPQQPIQKPFLTGTKSQPGLEPHAWPFPGKLQSLPQDDVFSVHSHSHGAFPRQKSPSLPSAFCQYSQSSSEQKEEGHKKEQKPKKPGKYICQYCGRACAKPSVLKKHIRSHTGERPYPCEPCGFSFKTKSNLYKHRKSHAHAIKAGLVPFSELATRTDIDQASSVGETEVQSDGDQSTDTDEETAEGAMYPEKSSSIPQISFDSNKGPLDKGGEPAYADSAEELAMASMKVPILIVPKQGLTSATIECTPFTEIRGSNIRGMVQGDESHTVKQRLALRLTDKKGQDSDQSLNLLSPHSKGSTDSGYFSRSESAEQQISPPNTNAKTYEEIMFGRSWYYRPISRSRHPVTMTATANPDSQNKSAMIEMDMGKISEDHIFFRGTQMVAACDPKQYPRGALLEAPSETGPLLRSNSMPTSSPTNLNVPSALRGSHSFDEMMSPDDVFYPGAAGLRRLRRQAAFEHGESENYGKMGGPFATMKMGERDQLMSEFKGSGSELACPEMRTAYGSCGTKIGVSEMTTRKRRKEKSVGDEEDCPGQYDDMKNVSLETSGDYDIKQGSQETLVAAHTGRGSMYSGYNSLESFDKVVHPEDVVLVQDTDRKAAGNVISVIQHTNLLSRPNSFEKTESIEHQSYHPEKPVGQLSEQSDPENTDDVQSPDSILRSESMEHQQQSDSELASISPSQQYHMPHKLVRQPNIQVPEIRVTEEPDKPEKEPEVPAKEPEKHVEEFQWPQRSETLSQLPAEKLPPKKKRLRLADMEHSSGESSFESTCTSLSRSPSQESNLSHSSSFSMSFDREDNMKSVSPTKQEDFSKQSEFLTVPGSGHSLSIPGHHKEMRRSSSEQSPCGLPTEVPETRSKSFDYGSLSTNSRQGELYASASSMKERRRGYLVRQASLSVYPEVVPQEQCSELNIKQELSDPHASPSWQGTSSLTAPPHLVAGSDLVRQKRGSYHLLQQSISEDSQSDDLQKSPCLPGQLSTDSEASIHEHMSQDIMHHSSVPSSLVSSPFFQTVVWYTDSTRPRQHQGIHQLQKLHIRPPNLQPNVQKSHQPLHQIQVHNESNTDGASQTYPYVSRGSPQTIGTSSKVLTTNSVFLQQIQAGFTTQNVGSQPSHPGMLVPVRIQTNVPSYGSVMYTSVSQILATHAQSTTSLRLIGSDNTSTSSLTGISSKHPIGFNLSKLLGHPERSLQYPLWKVPEPLPGRLNTGIPLSLTSGTISTTDASSSIGGSKRMLSPASSLELFIGNKQQKRIKEEKMYGQIVKELSAVELSNSSAPNDGDASPQPDVLKRDDLDDLERMSSSPPANYPSSIFSSASDVPQKESFTPPLQIVMNTSKRVESPEELDVDKATPDTISGPESMISSSDTQDELKQTKIPVNMLVQLAASQGGAVCGSTLLLTDLADVDQFFQFPSLRTTTSVSWCYLNYTKPNYAQTTPLTSVYGSWCVSSYNPNPLSLSTKATLALLCSKQRRNTETYTMAAMYQPGTGKLVSSLSWKQKFEQMKPELMKLDIGKLGKKIKGVISRDRVREDHGEKEASSKQAEPTRIKIFEGGYKSNEDYVYVRGRGRGKYICEECGIRCKKPSMLKKHIRTHTDVRPYVCKFCNFAFKTKGNLTKHMKSKAHMKKCLELGVSVTCIDDVEGVDTAEEIQRDTGKIGMLEIMAEHQFSDADDSDGAEEDGDEVDEDEDDDDDYDGDSTPKTPSRSTSPQPYVIPSHSVTAVAASHDTGPDPLGSASKQPLFGYYASLPSIQITQLMVPSEKTRESQMAEYQKLLQGALGEDPKNRLEMPSSMGEDPGLSPEHSSSSFEFSPSRLSSPSCDSSPLREPSPSCRYLSPKRDLSPRGRLSPRREASPLRPLSPRRDMYRKDLSPRRDMSPRSLLSPISHTGCPVSPARDLSYRRELSPRGRHKGILRPLSPRRAPHPHSGPWTLNQHPHREMVSVAQKSRSHSEMNMNQRKSCYPQGDIHSTGAPSTHQGLFSHLPLHSQQQVRTLFPMIPIGGIQIVPGLAHPARLPLKTATSEESSETSFRFSEGYESNDTQGAEDSAQPQEMALSPKAVSSVPSPSSQRSRDDGKKQEEGIMTCTKAIASLRIASEEPLGKVAGSIEQIQQHTLSHSPTPQQESTARGIQKFSSSEFRHTNTETGVSATSKAPTGACPTLYITGATERSPDPQGHSKNPSSTTND
ncbi:transcription factor HIVEP2a [Ictalurus furcatus]|uniref:transcription factor HIVEP2a n=1 Tax=Ictalurus furcatus TaxID=66913 RepID=UPI0023509D43|nr:transcription factor HIVEP2a [Ictalurus furcatus]XP_053503999.1 transcription factor HIVEP2a [Ictalurus furcatus]XP_053504010.1 transcription factor HIVEP2a [Ictalurus furcatus]XP_053504019.1 transcription factor HIVEP2a [Ictalurus furcatus]XP_053504024.1 transcription factor HIVEP2a [Ictalurus furcatus]XP_053504033.1 transcription factor HIVEP2a [Ictalurus furcatus]